MVLPGFSWLTPSLGPDSGAAGTLSAAAAFGHILGYFSESPLGLAVAWAPGHLWSLFCSKSMLERKPLLQAASYEAFTAPSL